MWKSGERVLARWCDFYWYPGVITRLGARRFFISFDDGDSAWVFGDQMWPLDLWVDRRVFGRWKGGGYYYPGLVDARDGEKIHILYDDGDQEWTVAGMIRVEENSRVKALDAWAEEDPNLGDGKPCAYKVGDRVFARWLDIGELCYPGIISAADQDRFFVNFDDGDKAWV